METLEQRKIRQERDALHAALQNILNAIVAVRAAEDAWIKSGHAESEGQALEDAWATVVIRENEARALLSDVAARAERRAEG